MLAITDWCAKKKTGFSGRSGLRNGRRPRAEEVGGLYNDFTRGNFQQTIFHREGFKLLLRKKKARQSDDQPKN